MCLTNITPWSSCWKGVWNPCCQVLQKLDIHSYDVLLSCITYTKQLLSSLFPYSGSVEMSYSSDPLSAPLLLDLSVDIGFLLAVQGCLQGLYLSLELLLSQRILQVW
jgi:hypothetical protein